MKYAGLLVISLSLAKLPLGRADIRNLQKDDSQRNITQKDPEYRVDVAADRFLKFLNETNIPEKVLSRIAQITPPVEATPGINTVTRLTQLIPEEVRENILASVPEKVDFPGTRFWDAAAKAWENTEAIGRQARNDLEQSGRFNATRDAIRNYNEYMAWRTDLPFRIYDEGVKAFRNATQPLFDTRTQIIESRDTAIASALRRQERTWEPAVNVSQAIGERILEGRSRVSDFADRLFLGRVSHALQDARNVIWKISADGRYTLKAAQLCILNPICCENPAACLGNGLAKD